jgi:hypothetical protein
LAGHPFGIWKELDPLDGPADTRHWLVRTYGVVYAAMARLGFTDVDAVGRMDVWRIAAILNIDAPESDSEGTSGRESEGRNLLRARLRHAQDPEHYPKPEAAPPSRAQAEALRRRLDRERG